MKILCAGCHASWIRVRLVSILTHSPENIRDRVMPSCPFVGLTRRQFTVIRLDSAKEYHVARHALWIHVTSQSGEQSHSTPNRASGIEMWNLTRPAARLAPDVPHAALSAKGPASDSKAISESWISIKCGKVTKRWPRPTSSLRISIHRNSESLRISS